MYAIIVDGGRQYRVEDGQMLDIDYREAVEAGATLSFPRVLAIGGEDGLKLGQPTVEGASVTAEVIGVQLADKIFVEKFRRNKQYHRRTGHRQKHTRIRITGIQA